MKVDILAFAAHPDDVEISCSGTLIKHIEAGHKVGIVDLTRGELGTRGTAQIRAKEAAAATAMMGISIRENLGLEDGFFEVSSENKLKIVQQIRRFKPTIVMANAITDRHPDHGRASKLVSDACFLAGLIKVKTTYDGIEQEAWRPKVVYHYIQDRYMKPDFIVDITTVMEKRMNALMAYSSQFYDPNSNEPVTAISTTQFLDNLRGRAIDFGRIIGTEYGEGFVAERVIGVQSLFDIY
jgi:bacillithiol biosynthesis deacetylase BshB1